MTNINGKAYAMNAITPMKPWKTPVLRVIFLILGAVKPLQAGLKNLSFIHFARWVIVGRDRFPHLSPQQPREDLQSGPRNRGADLTRLRLAPAAAPRPRL